MLGKIIKYDMKDGWRKLGPLYGLTLAMALVLGLSGKFAPSGGLNTMAIIGYTVFATAVTIMTLVYLISVYRKNLLGDQAHFVLTLPVEVSTQIWGKVISSFLWLAISRIFLLLSITVIAAPEMNDVKINVSFNDLVKAFNEIPVHDSGRIAGAVLSVIALAIIVDFVLIITIYAALTVGHLASSHRGLVSVAVAFVLMVCEIIAAGKIINKVGFTGSGAMELVIPLLVGAAIFAALFLLTDYLVRNKLDLE